MERKLVLLSILLFCFTAPAEATDYLHTYDEDGLRINIDISGSTGSPGYVPFNLDISNKLKERTIVITNHTQRYFNYAGGGFYGGRIDRQGALEVLTTLRLKVGDQLHLTIPVPVAAEGENGQIQVREGGRVLHTAPFNFQTTGSPDLAPALIVADPAGPFGRIARDLPRTRFSGSAKTAPGMPPVPPGLSSSGPIDMTREPERLPTNWLGFTTLRAVFIGAREWVGLSETQKDALLAWTASGGDLCLVDGDWTTLFPRADRRPAVIGSGGASERYFFGQIFFTSADALMEKGIEGFLTEFRNGPNGWRAIYPRGLILSDPETEPLRKEAEKPRNHSSIIPNYTNWRLPMSAPPFFVGQPMDKGFKLPIPGLGGVSTRMYLAILVLFTVLIGPFNYGYLQRKKRQVLIVLTTPIISLVFIVLLAGYAVGGEGIGIRARAETLTFLDQTAKQAATRATVTLYAAGMAPWGGLRFPRDMAIVPTGSAGQMLIWSGSLDLTSSQQYTSGLIQARAPVNFDQIGFRTARERLTFSRAGDGIAVNNGLGATVQDLYYRSGGRVYALTAAVAPGAQGKLTAGAGKDLNALLHLTKVEPPSLETARVDEFQHFFLDSLADGAFFAVVDRSPFWDPGVTSIDEHGSFHVVAGYSGGEVL